MLLKPWFICRSRDFPFTQYKMSLHQCAAIIVLMIRTLVLLLSSICLRAAAVRFHFKTNEQRGNADLWRETCLFGAVDHRRAGLLLNVSAIVHCTACSKCTSEHSLFWSYSANCGSCRLCSISLRCFAPLLQELLMQRWSRAK